MLALLRRDFTELVDAQGVSHWVPLDYAPMTGEGTFFASDDDFAPRAELVHRALAEAPGLDQELRASGGEGDSSSLESTATGVPSDVSAGLPGARDTVRAYGERLMAGYADLRVRDLEPRFLGPLTAEDYDAAAKGAEVVGNKDRADVYRARAALERSKLSGKSASRVLDERNLTKAFKASEEELFAYCQKIATFDITGPSPLQAWKVLEGYEDKLHQYRDRAIAIGGPLSSVKPDPKAGNDPLKALADLITNIAILAVVGFVAWQAVPLIGAWMAKRKGEPPREHRTPILPGESKPLELPGSMEPAIP